MKREKVTSAQNAKVRELTPLQHRSAYRRETGLFVAEGRREVARCLDAGYVPRTFFYCPEIIGESELAEIFAKVPRKPAGGAGMANGGAMGTGGAKSDNSLTDNGVMAVEIPAEIYDKVAYRGGTEGILAVMHCKEHRLSDLHFGILPTDHITADQTVAGHSVASRTAGRDLPDEGNCRSGQTSAEKAPLIVVLERVEKPGNLGAVLRSADAAGADAVIICDSPSDLYNPNVIRSSTGTVFSMPIAEATTPEAIAWLKSREVRILTAQLQDSQWYYDTDMVNEVPTGGGEGGREDTGAGDISTAEGMRLGGVAIVMGTEDKGLSDIWRKAADAHIRIPMLGQADSLNVSVSAAVLLYEAVRQRRQKGLL